MSQILQVIVNAISLSLIYVLFATGLTLIMGIFDVCNFAYGEFVMVGGFTTYFIVAKYHLPYIIAPIAAMVIVSLIGVIFEKGIFYPMRNRGGLEPALATFGSSSILQTAVLVLFGGMPLGVPAILSGKISVGSAYFPADRLPIIIGGLLMIGLLFLFVQKTKLGLVIRALQQDQDAAALQGMNISNIREDNIPPCAIIFLRPQIIHTSLWTIHPCVQAGVHPPIISKMAAILPNNRYYTYFLGIIKSTCILLRLVYSYRPYKEPSLPMPLSL
jgi:hypothetical protein